ncbi:MAG: MFS transporter [Ktedonobacteraceae bacterium]|nr:MFS transporter [Chloroflexota bacterium]
MADSFSSSDAGSVPDPLPLAEVPDTMVPGEHEAFQAPTKSFSLGAQMFLALANVAFFITIYPTGGILIPAQVVALDPRNKVISLGLLSTFAALASVLGNPIAGALSDRTTWKLGRRRSWMLIGTCTGVIALLILANASSLPMLIVGAAMGQFFGSALLAGLSAVIPDRVPERQRGTASAIVSLAIPLSIILGAVLVSSILKLTRNNIAGAYYAIIVVLVVIIGLYVATMHEQPLPRHVVPPFKPGTFLAAFWINPRTYPDFSYAWLTRFLVILGYSVGVGYLNYYLRDVIKYTQHYPGHTIEEAAATLQIISALFLIIATVIFGILSDRLQRRKIFVMLASGIIALGLLPLALIHTWTMVEIAAAIIGFGFGAYLGVDIALVTQVLPRPQDRGKDLGLINIASAIPGLLAPGFGALVISLFAFDTILGYSILFVVATVIVLLGSVLVQPIKGVR